MKATLERERKLTAPPGFALPALPGDPLPVRELSSTYHDTTDLRLAAGGITLRYRTERGHGAWQLKLPHGEDRLELEFEGTARAVPAEVLDLLTAHLRGSGRRRSRGCAPAVPASSSAPATAGSPRSSTDAVVGVRGAPDRAPVRGDRGRAGRRHDAPT